ncbi:MAG: TSUP family transporter [Cellvibrionaceae bacterium]
MDFSLSAEVLALLFFVAIAAGFIDTLAGGGGLITIPVFLILQIPPLEALATNKLQASFGSFTASITMLRKRVIRWSKVRAAFFASLIGSSVGTVLVHFVEAELLIQLIPAILIAVALYFALVKQVGAVEKDAIISEKKYHLGVVPAIGFYDGFFGPGTGSFFTFANVALMGRTIINATANAKCLNFASNIASLVVFIASGHILWLVGAVMIIGQIIGARLGSHAVLNHGQTLIRPFIVIICLLMCIKLLLF